MRKWEKLSLSWKKDMVLLLLHLLCGGCYFVSFSNYYNYHYHYHYYCSYFDFFLFVFPFVIFFPLICIYFSLFSFFLHSSITLIFLIIFLKNNENKSQINKQNKKSFHKNYSVFIMILNRTFCMYEEKLGWC